MPVNHGQAVGELGSDVLLHCIMYLIHVRSFKTLVDLTLIQMGR